MTTVTVTKQFRDNFEVWAKSVVESGEWTREQMEGVPGHSDEMQALGFKGILRKFELADGPDRLRDTLMHRLPDGSYTKAAIDCPKRRFAAWDSFFAEKANEARNPYNGSRGVE